MLDTAGSGQAVVHVDAHGVVVGADAGAERMFGWPAGELLGQRVSVLVGDRLTGPMAAPPGVDLVLVALRRDGSRFPAQVTLGQPTQVAGAPALEVVLRQHTPAGGDGSGQARMPRAGLGAIAHELNNVLSVMLLYSELIDRSARGSSRPEYLAEVRSAAERGSELTGQLHSIAHQAGEAPTGAPRPAHPRLDEDLLLDAITDRLGEPGSR